MEMCWRCKMAMRYHYFLITEQISTMPGLKPKQGCSRKKKNKKWKWLINWSTLTPGYYWLLSTSNCPFKSCILFFSNSLEQVFLNSSNGDGSQRSMKQGYCAWEKHNTADRFLILLTLVSKLVLHTLLKSSGEKKLWKSALFAFMEFELLE